jgi:hypothetical protein
LNETRIRRLGRREGIGFMLETSNQYFHGFHLLLESHYDPRINHTDTYVLYAYQEVQNAVLSVLVPI